MTAALGPRLAAIADAIEPGSRVADVGTDHALLLAWLRQSGRIARGIGIDVASGPLSRARHTLDAADVDGIELRQGDGLQPLSLHEVDTVVLAGMGGARIIQLIEAAPSIVSELSRIVVQPNTDWTALRRFIATRRWPLLAETMVCDRGKFYVVFVVHPRPADDPQWSEDALSLGPRLLKERPVVFMDWLSRQLERTERALEGARRGRDPGPSPRVADLLARRAQLLRALRPSSPA